VSKTTCVLWRDRIARRRGLAWTFLLLGLTAAVGSTEIREGGQRALPVELRRFNKLANAAFESRVSTENLPVPQWLSVSAATGGTPIEITTPIPHGLTTGDSVVIKGVLGNETANGAWSVTVGTPTTFALDGSAGGGTYAGGGAVFPAAGQSIAPGKVNDRGELAWTPWFSGPAEFLPTEFFRSDGAGPVGEVQTVPETQPFTSFLNQEIDGSLFRPGEPLCLSIEARVADSTSDFQNLILTATVAFASTRTHRVSFPGRALSTEYRRFALCFSLDPSPIPENGVLRVGFVNQVLRGGGRSQPLYLARPMLNDGTEPMPWTAMVQQFPRVRDFH
jgi:hypothetical protein